MWGTVMFRDFMSHVFINAWFFPRRMSQELNSDSAVCSCVMSAVSFSKQSEKYTAACFVPHMILLLCIIIVLAAAAAELLARIVL